MNSEQIGEDIFSKTTSFSLLNFKFTQIFLMDQNGFFSKMIELSFNAAELSVNSAKLSTNAAEFWFFRRLLFLSHVKHDSTEY
jgi:hypothetical protein